ncbi:BlaI/MecI/CopY family transcriptional regulator [Ekhidna sp. To15]|uniref:BlaI/MecI/CopY family transcriptional regulator n=1 Tax=Ekhidna sp. To15 TaxID=3395267 RepID=UPI003F5211F6
MERLTKAEEPIMKIIWDKGDVFVKEIVEELPDETPYNTVSSLVRILESKGMVGHKAFGRTHQYFPLVNRGEYRKRMLKNMIVDYFDGSYKGLLSQILDDEEVTVEEVNEIKALLNKKS